MQLLDFVGIYSFHFFQKVLCFNHLKTSEDNAMTSIARAAEYRYFSFTYFYGKAYFGLAESVGA